jgi:DNA helicase-2/ATP-dependent DNA helicase PcrA
MKMVLLNAKGLSQEGYKLLNNPFFDSIIEKKLKGESETDDKPFSIKNVISRVTSVDWTTLDLFYQICGFEHFKAYFDLAENQQDEAPVCNLSMITQYLSKFMELYGNVLTASFTSNNLFLNVFAWGYLYSLYRLGESEYEDENDPFPKGSIPFITIHQSKGLEFPVVYLHAHKSKRSNRIEELIREFKPKNAEPLEQIGVFDDIRLFYVGCTRAENLLILGHPKANRTPHEGVKKIIGENFTDISQFDFSTLPKIKHSTKDKMVKPYSFTADYLLYERCPRQYMIFRKFGFVPSRSQTMFFGSLVHETIEDLHHYLIQMRKNETIS